MKRNASYPPVFCWIILAFLLNSCSKSSGYSSGNNNNPPPPSSSNAVTIVNMSYSPSSVTVTPGTTVTWTNSDAVVHTVTGAGFDSGNMANGVNFSKAFATAGSYAYHCSIHAGMNGTIVVKAY